MPLAPDTRLGRYEIRSKLGEGGMGEVYLAQDTQLRRPVALKLLPAEFSQSKERLRRFEQEAYAVAALNHPKKAKTRSIRCTRLFTRRLRRSAK
jgi:serine/threonine protein kinase